MAPYPLPDDLSQTVTTALSQDIGSGDITAQLVPLHHIAQATIICREQAILCGQHYAEACFKQLNKSITCQWQYGDGDQMSANDVICHITGPARALLTAERCALNFLQSLSGTATTVRQYADIMAGSKAKLYDTRKTIPGLRKAQKYAVRCGGGHNHRMGLYDAFLIKENHIMAAGSIAQAISKARDIAPHKSIEIEVENLGEYQQALNAKADIILLDNFDLDTMREAVTLNQGQAQLEASGGIALEDLIAVANTGVDRIAIGSLTKHNKAIDFSMRFKS
jgi:nicotinate-nucleotide pyrophosphorylase (carboxylating)